MSIVYLKKNLQYSVVNGMYQKSGNTWVSVSENDLLTRMRQNACFFYGEIEPTIEISAPLFIVAESCQCQALVNNNVYTTGILWSVVSGSTYASIDNNGLLSIESTANNADIVIQATYNSISATHSVNVTYKSGSTSETTTEISYNESGMPITTVTTVTENADGTSASTSTSITYGQDGEPVEKTNEEIDTQGNVSTQNIEYENGEEVVTNYEIVTPSGGSKEFNEDGVNTEYYGFDLTHGFELNIHFIFDLKKQPAGQHENHHNILTMKRSNPSPWYGFQIRNTSTNPIILGTQFATGSNTNTTIPSAATGEYYIRIVYNPTASTNSFVATNVLTGAKIYSSNLKFPDIEELRYLKVCIGFALDENGQPYRYSNVKVINFNITRT